MPLAIKAFEEGLSAHEATYLLLAKKWAARLQPLTRTYDGLQKMVAFRLPGIWLINPIEKS